VTASRSAVICIGNPLAADDGAGPAVHTLLSQEALPAAVDLLDGGTAGLGLLHLLADYRRVIIVDAADFGAEPGQLRIIDAHEIDDSDAVSPISLHGFDLSHVLRLARALDSLPESLQIVAVQINSAEPGVSMDPRVEAALLKAKKLVLELLAHS
jgi:hydrogenase maturation protease